MSATCMIDIPIHFTEIQFFKKNSGLGDLRESIGAKFASSKSLREKTYLTSGFVRGVLWSLEEVSGQQKKHINFPIKMIKKMTLRKIQTFWVNNRYILYLRHFLFCCITFWSKPNEKAINCGQININLTCATSHSFGRRKLLRWCYK